MAYASHPLFCYVKFTKLHHSTHSGLTCGHSGSRLGFVYQNALGREEQARDRGGVLQSDACHLGRVYDTSLAQVLILVGAGIIAEVALALAYLVDHHGAFTSSVGYNLAQGFLNGALHDLDTCLLIGVSALQVLQGSQGADVSGTTTRYDTFLENASSDATRQTNWTAGLLWQPVRFLRCQLNYTCEQYAARDTDPRNVVSLMFTGIF